MDKKQSLAEQLAELSNPKPAIFPEDVTLEDDAAKVCDFDEYEAIDVTPPVRTSTRRSRSDACLDEDPRYAGRAISRKDLEEFEDGELFVLGMGFCIGDGLLFLRMGSVGITEHKDLFTYLNTMRPLFVVY